MEIKSGIKTSEFWLTIIVIIGIFVLLYFGKITNIEQAVLIASSIFGVFGYSQSRGKVKAELIKKDIENE